MSVSCLTIPADVRSSTLIRCASWPVAAASHFPVDENATRRTRLVNVRVDVTLPSFRSNSDSVFRGYLDRCAAGDDLPFVPVMSKIIVRPYFGRELASVFRDFEMRNPEAVYFMLDGSHRTTALTLMKRLIAVVLYESDEDIVEAKTMVAFGQILENATLDHTLAENCEILRCHFHERPYFETVQQKTERLIRDGYILSGI